MSFGPSNRRPTLSQVPPPFNTNSDAADVVLRSTDGKDFYVSSSVLGEASPIFMKLSAVPHPPAETAGKEDYIGDKPVMKIFEDGRAVLTLIQCCYPALTPPIATLWDVFDVCHCGEKFLVEKAKQLGKTALTERAAGRQPFAVYPLAWLFGHMDIAKGIAKRAGWHSTFDREMLSISYDYRHVYDLVEGGALQALWSYNFWCHHEVAQLCNISELIDRKRGDWLPFWSKASTQCCAESVVWVIEWCREEDGEIIGPAAPDDEGTPWRVKTWFLDFLAALEEAVLHKPIDEVINNMGAMLRMSSATSTMCPKCRETFDDSFRRFTHKLHAIARRQVNGVGLRGADGTWH